MCLDSVPSGNYREEILIQFPVVVEDSLAEFVRGPGNRLTIGVPGVVTAEYFIAIA